MKQTLALLLSAFTLSFAACTKTDNSVNSFVPAMPYSNVTYFKGDMHDAKLAVTSFNGHNISIIYKGMYFTGTALENGVTYNITVSNGHTTATGKLYVVYYFYNGQLNITFMPAYIQFDQGSIFESHQYTLVN